MEMNQKWLLSKFHTLCTKASVSADNKQIIIAGYGHVSSKDMTDEQLKDACYKLQLQLDPKMAELDKWRKRVFAAIGGYLRFSGKDQSPALIKRIACRATEHDNFNDIPVDRLRNIYNAFSKRQKDEERSWKVMEDILSGNV